jgi:hypothetical protein
MNRRILRLLIPLLAAVAGLCACSANPSVGVGVGIPHTPIGVGVGVPLNPSGRAANVTYRPVVVDSQPTGAELFVNDQLVGSTPMTVAVPFYKGFWGQASGSARVVAKKPGYLAEGVQVFPASCGGVKTSPAGAAVGKVVIEMRPGQ